jgi:large subunit ribosomal protein L25
VSETSMAVQAREQAGKSIARKLRAAGQIPAVFYGPKIGSVPIALDPRRLERILRQSGANALLELSVEGRSDLGDTVALVKELQRHPVRGDLVHADLYQVDLTQKVEVEVPVHLVGKSKGVEMGGIIDHMIREVMVSCLPRAIPEAFEIDVSDLDIGDVVHARDIALPDDVELGIDPDLGIVHVAAPSVAEEEVPEEEAPEEAAAEGEAGAAVPSGESGGEES